MSIEAMKQALEALEYIHTETSQDEDELIHPAITALRQAILEAEKQEPVAWMHTVVANDGEPDHALSFATDNFPLQGVGGFKSVQVQPLYTHPPKREWVGLTDEELNSIYEKHHNQYAECISPNFGYERAIEAKLKENNS
jgi:hypothetical protein